MKIPVLPLSESIVLPGMVVPLPIEDHEVRAAVEAAQLTRDDAMGSNVRGPDSRAPNGERAARVALVPRLDGRYASVGTLAQLEQIG
ncbi:MAG: LON peptidase substrate-binding domain-containing protein, partial [Acidimicrobiaceae bacterium]|nr:LON peptidase substrate-binding domain-containing protein [Acidimicrobiaceae bacterium]